MEWGMMSEKDGQEFNYEDREWLRVTLYSIGDAVIATDMEGRVSFMNPVAESLTGWTLKQAVGVALESVFRIINEETRHTVENPATRALREGVVVGLANHTLLIARDGTERAIDDSAAPIRDGSGKVSGVVLVFRDVTERRIAEEQLRVSEERFRLLIEATQDYAIFMLDPHGTIISWNSGAERIKGYTAEEIIGTHFSIFYPQEANEAGWPQHELEITTAEGRFEDNGWRIRKDGSIFWANVIITALRDTSGRLRGFSKITRDLTERKLAEESFRSQQEQFRAMTESANDAIIFADEQGRVTFWNEVARRTFGYDDGEIVGMPLAMLMPERYREDLQRGLQSLSAGGEPHLIGKRVELYGLRRDGSEFPLELSLSTWTKNGERFYGGIMRDITERRQLERAKVEAEVLADLNRRKDEFLAMLSHELRNPLTPILNAVMLLQMEDDPDPVQQQAYAIIERQVGQLTRLVDDLLEVSRITTGSIRLQPEHVDIRGIVERAVEACQPLIVKQEHKLTLSLPSNPIWLYADATRMEQVVVNLLTNAAKYTENRGHIWVEVDQEGDKVVLSVKDTGVGISPDLLPRIFDLFTQGEKSLDRSQSGLGIGLTIVQRLVEMHGGSVEAFSSDTGSEFIARLPVAQSIGDTSHQSGDMPASEIQQLRLLIVDDNRDVAESAALWFSRAGHNVRVAYSGETAVEAALAFRPQAILLDIGLPEMDGYEVARRMRQHPQFRDVRLIAISGYGQEGDRILSHQAGFDAHLVKPVDPRKVQEVLETLMKDEGAG
jgi:PAS domain S-box-containing protein